MDCFFDICLWKSLGVSMELVTFAPHSVELSVRPSVGQRSLRSASLPRYGTVCIGITQLYLLYISGDEMHHSLSTKCGTEH